jgi:hypothetical protein
MTTTTNMPPDTDAKTKILEVFSYAKDEKTVFLWSDIFLGTSALWLPLFLGAIFFQKTTPWAELVKLLDAGSGYTFALPFLAASSSFFYLERKQGPINDLRDRVAPRTFGLCIFFAIIGPILTGAHFTALLFDKGAGGDLLNCVQFIFVAAVLGLGVRLFCLKNIVKLPDALSKYQAQEQEKAEAIRNAAKSDQQF